MQTAQQILVAANLHTSLWGQTIIKAQANNTFTHNALVNSFCIKTSPIGPKHLNVTLRRLNHSHVKNKKLNDLANQFNVSVTHNSFVLAARLLTQIHAYALTLVSGPSK